MKRRPATEIKHYPTLEAAEADLKEGEYIMHPASYAALKHQDRLIFWRQVLISVVIVLIMICFGMFGYYLGKADYAKYATEHPICK